MSFYNKLRALVTGNPDFLLLDQLPEETAPEPVVEVQYTPEQQASYESLKVALVEQALQEDKAMSENVDWATVFKENLDPREQKKYIYHIGYKVARKATRDMVNEALRVNGECSFVAGQYVTEEVIHVAAPLLFDKAKNLVCLQQNPHNKGNWRLMTLCPRYISFYEKTPQYRLLKPAEGNPWMVCIDPDQIRAMLARAKAKRVRARTDRTVSPYEAEALLKTGNWARVN